MLTRLLPEQIAEHWDIIKYAIDQSLPPIVTDHPDKMNRILSSALSGGTTVWVSYTKVKEMNRFEAVILTKFLFDDVSNTKNLLIYSLFGYEVIDKESWMQGLEGIAKFAKARGCSKIVAYTDQPHVIDLVNKLGGETIYTFVSFNL